MGCILKTLLSVIMVSRQHTVFDLWAKVPYLVLVSLYFAVSIDTTLGLRCFRPSLVRARCTVLTLTFGTDFC